MCYCYCISNLLLAQLSITMPLTIIKGIPDLERLLTRVHATALKKQALNHPDSRAILYEENVYNSRKIRDFADLLSGFESVLKVVQVFRNIPFKSALLRSVLTEPNNGGKFPFKEIESLLRHLREIFDEKQAKKDGNIRPRYEK